MGEVLKTGWWDNERREWEYLLLEGTLTSYIMNGREFVCLCVCLFVTLSYVLITASGFKKETYNDDSFLKTVMKVMAENFNVH